MAEWDRLVLCCSNNLPVKVFEKPIEVDLLAPSQRYSTIKEEEACQLWPENKWLLEKVKEGVVVVPNRKLWDLKRVYKKYCRVCY
jgi:hypothetical protein